MSFAARGALIGLVVYLVFFFVSLLTGSDFSVMGVKNEILTRLVSERYLGRIVLYQFRIAAAYAGIGLGLGTAVGVVLFFLEGSNENRILSRRSTILVVSGLVVIHLYVGFRGMIIQPQLFTERFYDTGGLRRGLQVFLTDRLSLPGLNLMAAVFLLAGFLLAVYRFGLPRFARFRFASFRRVSVTLVLGGILAIGAVALMSGRVSHPAGEGRPNLILIVVDSLRTDRLSCHGTRASIAPSIDRLCRDGFDFRQAYVSLPRTFPSLVTILTGLYPDHHGVRHMFPTAEDRERGPVGLASVLARAGYRSRAISDFSGDVLTRIDLGFDRIQAPTFNFPMLLKIRSLELHPFLIPYLDNPWGRALFPERRELVSASDPSVLGREAVQAIREMKDDPFFLLVFFSTPHFPYAAPYPDYARFTDPAYAGPYKYHKPNLINTAETVGPDDIRQVRGLYDGAVAGVDRQVGRILEALEKNGILERSIVVLTADHGENLYEEDRGMGHGEHLRGDDVLRVPLIIRDPLLSPNPARIDAVVRSVDLVPTWLDRLGVPDPIRRDGVSLMPLLRGHADDLGLSVFAETGIWFVDSGPQFFQRQRLDYPNVIGLMEVDSAGSDEIVLKEEYRDLIEAAKHRMVLSRGYKLISMPTRQGVRYELYDHTADPADEHPLDPKRHAEIFDSLRAELWNWMGGGSGYAVRNGYRLPIPNEGPP